MSWPGRKLLNKKNNPKTTIKIDTPTDITTKATNWRNSKYCKNTKQKQKKRKIIIITEQEKLLNKMLMEMVKRWGDPTRAWSSLWSVVAKTRTPITKATIITRSWKSNNNNSNCNNNNNNKTQARPGQAKTTNPTVRQQNTKYRKKLANKRPKEHEEMK